MLLNSIPIPISICIIFMQSWQQQNTRRTHLNKDLFALNLLFLHFEAHSEMIAGCFARCFLLRMLLLLWAMHASFMAFKCNQEMHFPAAAAFDLHTRCGKTLAHALAHLNTNVNVYWRITRFSRWLQRKIAKASCSVELWLLLIGLYLHWQMDTTSKVNEMFSHNLRYINNINIP